MYVYASTFLAIVMITYNVFIRILNITDMRSMKLVKTILPYNIDHHTHITMVPRVPRLLSA